MRTQVSLSGQQAGQLTSSPSPNPTQRFANAGLNLSGQPAVQGRRDKGRKQRVFRCFHQSPPVLPRSCTAGGSGAAGGEEEEDGAEAGGWEPGGTNQLRAAGSRGSVYPLADDAELETRRGLRGTMESHDTGVLLTGHRGTVRPSCSARRTPWRGAGAQRGCTRAVGHGARRERFPAAVCGPPGSMCPAERNGERFGVIL